MAPNVVSEVERLLEVEAAVGLDEDIKTEVIPVVEVGIA